MATSIQLQPARTIETLIAPTDRQREFLKAIDDYDFVLYGGAAGGGKSYILRWWLFRYLVQMYREHGLRNVQVGLFCEDYPSLHDRHISKIKFEFPPEIGELKQGVVKNFQLHPKYGGGVIALRNLDDPSKYLSSEFAAIAVDELTKNEKPVFDFLRSRLRWPGVERPKFAGGTNPGGKGHAWVKKLWLDKEFPPELEPLRPQFAFVQAKASDNKHLTTAYYQNLLTLPPEMARAYAEGSWDIFAGQYFDLFNTAVHTRFATEMEPWESRWISIDWGYDHPSAVQWHATIAEGQHVTYREFVQNHLTPKMLATAIVEQTRGEKIANVYLAPDAFGQRISYETIASQLDEEFRRVGLPSPEMADDERVGGWMLMYSLLQAGQWTIDPSCRHLIQGIQSATRDYPKKPEDVLKAAGDDSIDCARYGIKSRLSLAPIPRNVLIERKVTSPDMSIAMVQRRKAELEIQSSSPMPVRRLHPSMRRWQRN